MAGTHLFAILCFPQAQLGPRVRSLVQPGNEDAKRRVGTAHQLQAEVAKVSSLCPFTGRRAVLKKIYKF
jgi:hypothetical protein